MRIILTFLLFTLSCSAFASSFSEHPQVKAFIEEMALKHQFDKQKLISIFNTVKIQSQVLDSIKNPMEKETWGLYQKLFITSQNIENGALFRKQYHRALLAAEKKYGVPGSIIIATLGVETKYGKHMGEYRVLDSLSSLAFSNERRSKFFKSELKEFLLLTREQHLDPLAIKGSYAGAIGAPQFMPSSYRYYADSFTKKSKIDLIHNIKDAIASVGNYYKKHGWKSPHFVAIPAKVKGVKYKKLFTADGKQKAFYARKLSSYGIVPERKIAPGYKLKLLELENAHQKEFWLVFSDFDVIKKYNSSNLYAMSVYKLSREILKYHKDK